MGGKPRIWRQPLDARLVERTRAALAGRGDPIEKRVFGGLSFMIRGYMVVGVLGGNLIVRVPGDDWEDALAQPGAGPLEMGRAPPRGFVVVRGEAVAGDAALRRWVDRGLATADTLPPR